MESVLHESSGTWEADYDDQYPLSQDNGPPAYKGAVPLNVMDDAEKIFDDIIHNRGIRKLFEYTQKFEEHRIDTENIKVSAAEINSAVASISPEDRQTIDLAAERIRAYHQKQRPTGFIFDDGRGTVIEEKIVPLERVGICIPGGQFPLASTVLMTAIPARIAGVRDIVMINPWPKGRMNPHVLAAAHIAGVDVIYKVGGVQGVAALARGWLGGPVDKIVGPGSVWVTAGKAIAFARGYCGIDSLAGPSEVAIVADASANPAWIAYDLLSQAEHGTHSWADLITDSEELITGVEEALNRLALELGEPDWLRRGAENITAYLLRDEAQMAEAVNHIVPEHLEIMTANPQSLVNNITNAASIFIGPYSPVPAGDYMAGGNHVLPTGGTARFASPLSVYDFVKRQSVTTLSAEGLKAIADPVARFAEIEGLTAHALAVRKRFSP
jgi:histidinol dehydrogenase